MEMSGLYAQEQNASLSAGPMVSLPARIDTLIIVGNEKTKSYIISREIPFTFPDTLDKKDFQLIQNRLQNLYLFNRVELLLSPFGGQNALIVMVTESWYFFPAPILFINERDWSKISYGMQVSHYNFRGRNEKLSFGGWLGYNPSYYLNYFNPWVGRKSRIILGFSLSRNQVANKIFDFKERRSSFGFTIGRKHTLNLQTQFSFSIQNVILPSEYRDYSYSGNGRDWVPTFTYELIWDRRDLFEYPKKGFYLRYQIRRVGLTKKEPRFWRFETDNRIYLPVYKQTTLGFRNLLILNKGELPIYDRVFLGYSERIRGYFDKVFPAPETFREYNSAKLSLSSVEFRFPILPVKYFSWDSAPLFSSLYRNLKFGISGGIFFDSGIVWQDKSQFALPNFYSGYGAGLHFHLPYVYVLRLEYAWNDKGQGQYIVDMGVSF